MPLSHLLQAHFRQILKLEGRAVRDLFAVYRDTRIDIAEKLAALDARGDGETFTAQHLALILAQVDSALRVMWQAHGRSLDQHFREALQLGATQELSEIVDLERRLGSTTLAERIGGFLPAIPAEMVATLARPANLLLSRFKDGVQTGISRALAVSASMGESIAKTTRRLGKVMDGERYQLERIARTEINQAANYGHFHTVDAVAQKFPAADLQKQWSAHLDDRTSRRCRGLHLTVVDVREEFVAKDGWRGLYPPAHPNCRSRVMPYSPRWEASSVKKIAEEAAGAAANPHEDSNPTQADRRGAARSNQARGVLPAPEP